MKPFRFTLQAVKTLRQRQEQKAMEQYARDLHAQRLAVDRLSQVQGELETAWCDWNNAVAEGCSAAVLAQTQAYFQTVEVRRQRSLDHVRECERHVQEALDGMLRSRRDREAADSFFDAQKAVYDRALDRDERKTLDEMAQRRTVGILLWSSVNAESHE